MIRKAVEDDIHAILSITEEVKKLMNEKGNEQWNDSYPLYNDFITDITNKELFVFTEDDGVIVGFICLNFSQPPEYDSVHWRLDNKALVIHRMAVNPEFHRLGVAKKMMGFAEEKSLEYGVNYIRSDTCSINKGMNALFRNLNYNFTGNIRFPRSHHIFNCYEKAID